MSSVAEIQYLDTNQKVFVFATDFVESKLGLESNKWSKLQSQNESIVLSGGLTYKSKKFVPPHKYNVFCEHDIMYHFTHTLNGIFFTPLSTLIVDIKTPLLVFTLIQ